MNYQLIAAGTSIYLLIAIGVFYFLSVTYEGTPAKYNLIASFLWPILGFLSFALILWLLRIESLEDEIPPEEYPTNT